MGHTQFWFTAWLIFWQLTFDAWAVFTIGLVHQKNNFLTHEIIFFGIREGLILTTNYSLMIQVIASTQSFKYNHGELSVYFPEGYGNVA